MRLINGYILFGVVFIIGEHLVFIDRLTTYRNVFAFKYFEKDCVYFYFFFLPFWNVTENCRSFFFCFHQCWNRVKGPSRVLYETNHSLFLLSSRSPSCKCKSSIKHDAARRPRSALSAYISQYSLWTTLLREHCLKKRKSKQMEWA